MYRFLSFFLFVPLVTSTVLAETCDNWSLAQSYAAADVVFTATITEVSNSDANDNNVCAHFRAIEVFKGVPAFMCIGTTKLSVGYKFEPGREYLVFVDSSGWTLGCTGTHATWRDDGQTSVGETWVESLRSFKAGRSSLATPWLFFRLQHGCLLTGHTDTTNLAHPISMSLTSAKLGGRRNPSSIVTLQYASPSYSVDDRAERRAAGSIRFRGIQLDIPGGVLSPGMQSVWTDRGTLVGIATELAELSISGGRAEITTDLSSPESLSLGPDSTDAIRDFLACESEQ